MEVVLYLRVVLCSSREARQRSALDLLVCRLDRRVANPNPPNLQRVAAVCKTSRRTSNVTETVRSYLDKVPRVVNVFDEVAQGLESLDFRRDIGFVVAR